MGFSVERTGTSSSNFSACSSWDSGDDLAAAAEEGIAGEVDAVAEAEQVGDAVGALDPRLAERLDLRRRADAHVLAHAERLEAVDVGRRLAAEAVGGDVEDEAGGRAPAPRVAAIG